MKMLKNLIFTDYYYPFDKINFKKMIHMLLYQALVYYTWKNSITKIENFKLSAPTKNKKFELADGLYSVSYVKNYIEYIKKKTRNSY